MEFTHCLVCLFSRYGSNLTESGTIEMDAGLMDGTSLLFGAVGAITEVTIVLSLHHVQL